MSNSARSAAAISSAGLALWAYAAIPAAPAAAAPAEAAARAAHCSRTVLEGVPLAVCRFDPTTDDIRLFLYRADGEPYRRFSRLEAALAAKGERLLFAMNAGMYHPNRAPVGLFVEDGVERSPVNRRDCAANFCMKPNGVFSISADGEARVTETRAFIAAARKTRYATQSGPMLVIGGAIHPRFLEDSASRHRRNGVGVTAEGEVVFAIADAPVNFHTFARFFRDELKTENALYLDGAISRLHAPELGRSDGGAAMGPIVGVVAPAE